MLSQKIEYNVRVQTLDDGRILAVVSCYTYNYFGKQILGCTSGMAYKEYGKETIDTIALMQAAKRDALTRLAEKQAEYIAKQAEDVTQA